MYLWYSLEGGRCSKLVANAGQPFLLGNAHVRSYIFSDDQFCLDLLIAGPMVIEYRANIFAEISDPLKLPVVGWELVPEYVEEMFVVRD